MLKRLDVKNFESHEHSVVDFSDGFNLICGPSNSGKSSLIRSLKLVCYGDWDPESLRKGAKTCTVELTTDKGRVRVTRGGSTNEWEVEPLGEPIKKFSKPGKGIVDEAAAIVGLKTVKMGTQEVRPNVMDQLEGHFLMAELEGEKTSGSTRAQVVDEISGLAGMEDIIREVNLDNVRNAREIKTSEQQAIDTEAAKHDQTTLDAENTALQTAQAHLDAYDESQVHLDRIIALNASHCETAASLKTSKTALKAIPDTDKARTLLDNAATGATDAAQATRLSEKAQQTRSEIDDATKTLSKMPDTTKVKAKIDAATSKLDEAKTASDLCMTAGQVKDGIATVQSGLAAIPDTAKAETHLDKAETTRKTLTAVRKVMEQSSTARTALDGCNTDMTTLTVDIDAANATLKDAMDGVETCPICLGPRHDGCGHTPKRKARIS